MEVSDDLVGSVMRAGKRLVAGASLRLAYCNRRLVSVSSAWKLDTVTVLPPATRYFYVERGGVSRVVKATESHLVYFISNFIFRFLSFNFDFSYC